MTDAVSEPDPYGVSNESEASLQKSETFFNRLVGINEAATISYASKGQISRDTKNKSLSFSLDEKGQKRYKVADLYQKYGFREPSEASIKKELKPFGNPHETPNIDIELAVLQTELKAKEEAIRRMEDEIRDLRQKQDRQLETIQRFTLLLSAPKESKPVPMLALEPERKGFWQRLFR
jgi:hypothetical protein